MTYCEPSHVRLVIKTKLEDDDIQNIINWSDAEIDRRLGSQSATDLFIRKLSVLLTASTIKTRQPTSVALGEYRESHNPLTVWSREIDRIFASYQGAAVYDNVIHPRTMNNTTNITDNGVRTRYKGSYFINGGSSTGTGAQQTIPHKLAGTPGIVLLSPPTANPYESASADATNIYVTADSGEKWYWYVEYKP